MEIPFTEFDKIHSVRKYIMLNIIHRRRSRYGWVVAIEIVNNIFGSETERSALDTKIKKEIQIVFPKRVLVRVYFCSEANINHLNCGIAAIHF